MTATPHSDSSDSTRYSWAEHLIWMEGGEPVEEKRQGSPVGGVILILVLTAFAFLLNHFVSGTGWRYAGMLDTVLLGMLLGLAVGNLKISNSLLPGASFSVRKLLPLGIILL